MLNPLLVRQLRRFGILDHLEPPDTEVWGRFLEKVSSTYRDFEEGHYLLERSLSISSEEMSQLNRSLQDSEAGLAAERDKLQATFDSLGDGLCVMDRNARCLDLNAAGAQLLGWKEGEALGRDILESISELPLVARSVEGVVRVDEASFKRRDGTEFPAAFVLTRMVREGELRGYVLAFRDVTERKRVQDVLNREHQQLLDIIASAPIAMAMFDCSMRYLTHSQKWLEEYGLQGKSIIGVSHYDVFPDIPERWREFHRRALQGEVVTSPEDVFERSDGSRLFLRWAIHPWHTPEGRIGGIVIVADRIDDLVNARESALESARLKSEFLANMSHEVRTPMNGVLGMTELLLGTRLDEAQREFADSIRMSAVNLLEILNEILDFSKIEAGKLDLVTEEFELREIVDEVTRVFAVNAKLKRIGLSSEIEASIPRYVCGDAGRLRQVLTNLVGNAIKFTESGRVQVVARLGSSGDREVRIRFEVVDTGVGVSVESQKRLFKAFSQCDGSMTRRHGGTGLGLAICRQLVDLMKGEIGVRSEAGIGSTFWFELGFQASLEARTDSPTDARRRSGGQALIAIRDPGRDRDLLRSHLEARGLQVRTVSSGQEGLGLLTRGLKNVHPFRIVLVAESLAGLDGRVVVRAIRETPELHGSPRILLLRRAGSGLADPPPDFSANVDEVVRLPIEEAELEAALTRVLDDEPVHPEPRAPLPSPVGLDAAIATAADQPPAGGPLILVAEDNSVNRKITTHMLQKLGYRVSLAVNGREVLDRLGEQQVACVLMDCQMPEMDGFEATRLLRLRERGTGRRLPVVAVTAHAMEGDRDRCLRGGMDDYLTKPFSSEQLARVLGRWCPVGTRVSP